MSLASGLLKSLQQVALSRNGFQTPLHEVALDVIRYTKECRAGSSSRSGWSLWIAAGWLPRNGGSLQLLATCLKEWRAGSPTRSGWPLRVVPCRAGALVAERVRSDTQLVQ
ncbi:hypothetical protein F2Q70_00027431 [Brassica cretica]|uniref:Uncharacterized protein n=1 Tax=Brassica cretica TaxID=69181 RepID=A0A8S9L9L7_BRACR|nr:hypothetical protein F2Q70_00027431 [Brassica cretica]